MVGKKKGIFLFEKYILQNGENSPPGFFFFYYSLRGIRVLLELPRWSPQMVPRANGGARSAAFSLARLLPSLVCVALRCVALRPPPPCVHAGGGCSLGPESGAASFWYWLLGCGKGNCEWPWIHGDPIARRCGKRARLCGGKQSGGMREREREKKREDKQNKERKAIKREVY